MASVIDDQSQRIGEDCRGFLERDSVLPVRFGRPRPTRTARTLVYYTSGRAQRLGPHEEPRRAASRRLPELTLHLLVRGARTYERTAEAACEAAIAISAARRSERFPQRVRDAA